MTTMTPREPERRMEQRPEPKRASTSEAMQSEPEKRGMGKVIGGMAAAIALIAGIGYGALNLMPSTATTASPASATGLTTTTGVRLLDRKLTLSAQWSAVAANTDLPPGYTPSTSYNLVNLYATYQPTKDVVINLGIDNVLNEYYRPYAVPGSSSDGTTQNDVLWTSPGPGITYKAAIKVHFGGV